MVITASNLFSTTLTNNGEETEFRRNHEETAMKIITLLSTIVLLLLGIVFAGLAWADPDGPQHLRGMDDRVFGVEVTNLAAECFDADGTNDPPDCNFFNCYTFHANGDWDDPLFPALGSWDQDSNGTATSYTGDASFLVPDGGPLVTLEQNGSVTPARGGGALQLNALSEVFLDFGGGPIGPVAIYHSVGEEITAEDAAEACP
jgi:hypothetical protein